MAKPIEVELLLNNKDVIRGSKDTADALGDVADSLDDLASTGEKATGKLVDAVGDASEAMGHLSDDARDTGKDVSKNIGEGASDAGESIGKLEAKFKDLADSAKREDKTATDSVKDDWTGASKHIELKSREGFHAAGETTKAFKEEAVANFSATASSFDGSVQGIADGVQGTLGGLAQSLPLPFGVALGVLGGLFGAAFSGVTADADRMKQQVQDDFDDMVNSGSKYLSDQFLIQQAQQLINDKVDGQRPYADMISDAKFLGISVDKVVLAYAGQTSAIDEVRAAVERVNKANTTFTDETQFAGFKNELGTITGQLDSVSSSITTAGGKAKVFDQVTQSLVGVAGSADDVQAAIDNIPDDKTVTVSVVPPDLAKAEKALTGFVSKDRTVKVNIAAYVSRGRRVF